MTFEVPQLIQNYAQLVPYVLAAFLISLFATPLVAKLAHYLGALDVPAKFSRNARNAEKKINDKITPRLGGLSMVIAISVVLLLSQSVGFSSWGVWAGLAVVTIIGVVDDIFDLPAVFQLMAQICAAILVVVGGSTIDSISFAGQIYEFVNLPLLADAITVFWIVAIINFVNWASGIDALNGGISSIAALALLLIALQTGKPELAVLISIHLGSILGVLPFNYHPSKIFYGFGESVNGFLLAVFALSGDIKFAASIIVLGLPLIDAVWVACTRMYLRYKETRNPVSIVLSTMKSDRNHLHHRLLDLGYSWKTVLYIELMIMTVLSTIAFTITGFSVTAIQVMIVIVGVLFIFIVINYARHKVRQQRAAELAEKAAEPQIEIKRIDPQSEADNPEERYQY